MKNKLGLYFSIVLTASTIIFSLTILTRLSIISYFISMIISFSYIILNSCFLGETIKSKRHFGYASLSFALIYSAFINLVYLIIIIFYKNIRYENILGYSSIENIILNLYIFGFSIMSISTVLLGFSINVENKKDEALKILLIVHGIFTPPFMLISMINVAVTIENIIETTILFIWALYFIPVCILFIFHFKQKKDQYK